MGIDVNHFYDLVICETLENMATYNKIFSSEQSKLLLLATFCHESKCGTYLRQVVNNGYGTAFGVFQIEPKTHDWIINDWLLRKKDLFKFVLSKFGSDLHKERLIYDLKYSTLIARLRYFIVKEPIPNTKSIYEFADYWGKYYQTENDPNKKMKFIENAKKYSKEFFDF